MLLSLNALYTCLSQTLTRLQLVQNAAARILTKNSHRSRITPNLASLHWLPVEFRIDFKILLIHFKAPPGLAPRFAFRSSWLPTIPVATWDRPACTCSLTLGQGWLVGVTALSLSGPLRLWNSLTDMIGLVNSLPNFITAQNIFL